METKQQLLYDISNVFDYLCSSAEPTTKNNVIAPLEGIILGGAYGDVLGSPFENLKPGQIQQFYGVQESKPSVSPSQKKKRTKAKRPEVTTRFDLNLFMDKTPLHLKYDQKNRRAPESAEQAFEQDLKCYPAQKIVQSKGNVKNTLLLLRKLRPLGVHSDDTQFVLAFINAIREYYNTKKEARGEVETAEASATTTSPGATTTMKVRSVLEVFMENYGHKKGAEEAGTKFELEKGFISWNLAAMKKDDYSIRAFRDYGANYKEASKKMKKFYNTNILQNPQLVPEHQQELNKLGLLLVGSNSSGMGSSLKFGVFPALLLLATSNGHIENMSPEKVQQIQELLQSVCLSLTALTHGSVHSAALSFAIALVHLYFIAYKHSHTDETLLQKIYKELPGAVHQFESKTVKKYQLTSSHFVLEHPHAISNSLSVVFAYIQKLAKDDEEVSSDERSSSEELDDEEEIQNSTGSKISLLRKKITSNALQYFKESKQKISSANQGHAAVGGIHAIAMALLPTSMEIDASIISFVPTAPRKASSTIPINNKSFPNVVLHSTCSLGYDSDTVASLSGQILGIRFGASWIPKHCILDLPRLQQYYEIPESGSTPGLVTSTQFVEHERMLTSYEHMFKNFMLDKLCPRLDGSSRFLYHSLHHFKTQPRRISEDDE